MDFKNFGARKVGVFTDKTVAKLLPMQMAIESLEAAGVNYEVFDKVRVEPNQVSSVRYCTVPSGILHHDYDLLTRLNGRVDGLRRSTLRRRMTSRTSSPSEAGPSSTHACVHVRSRRHAHRELNSSFP